MAIIKVNIKILTILSILLLLFVSINSVNAFDDNETLATVDQEIVSEVDESSTMKLDDEILGTDENQETLTADGDVSDLETEINNAAATLELNKNYTFTASSGEGITISKNLEIDGKGNYIDASKQGRIFKIDNGYTLTLKNIIIKNGYHSNGDGGAILCSGTLNLINSQFIDNYANITGGAVYSKFGTVENCSFTDNYAGNGGAIRWTNNLNLLNSNFTDNVAGWNGGAIYSSYVIVDNCKFIDNRALTGVAGAIYSQSSGIISNSNFTDNTGNRGLRFAYDFELYNSTLRNTSLVVGGNAHIENSSFINCEGAGIVTIEKLGNVVNCNFTNNSAGSFGGGLTISRGTVSNCIFTNNTSKVWGGAIYFGQAGSFTNIVENCTFNNNTASGHGGAIYFFTGVSKIVNCKFNNNSANGTGGAVSYYGVGGSIFNSTFVNNTCGNSNSGGAIYCGSSLHLSYCNFTKNNAGASGGAFRIQGNSNILNCNFIDNTAKSASAFLLYDGIVENCNIAGNRARSTDSIAPGAVSISQEGSVLNCNFTNNTATFGSGGALHINSGIVFNCLFINNSIGLRGGAVSTNRGTISDCNFTNNSASLGGAIFINNFGTVENCIFFNNTALTSSGGAIYVNSPGETIINCNFTNNNAYINGGSIYSRSGTIEYCNFINCSVGSSEAAGGAIYSESSTIGYCNFTNNTVKNTRYGGGAVFLKSGEIAYCDFTKNTADIGNGGAILMSSVTVMYCNFTDNVATNGHGGAISSSTGNIQYCNFLNNTALLQSGGAIYTSSKGAVGDCNFTNNSAAFGGAIRFTDTSTVENCNFINNTAIGNINSNVGGGAIHFNYGGTVSSSNFINNSKLNAGQNTGGGAIFFRCAANGATAMVDNCNFTNNYARYNDFGGGAICILGAGTINDCNFKNNTAYSSYTNFCGGGAVYFYNGGSVLNSNFVNNSRFGITLTPGGGAVFFRSNGAGSSGLVEYCNFTDNFADGHGGAVVFIRSGIVDNSNFTNNSVKEGNGGAVYFHASVGEVSNSIFINNAAKDGGGAGIYINSGASAIVENCKFINNRVGYYGGAVSGSACVVTNSSFDNNHARMTGGAISLSSGNVLYCNFINNTANGGAYTAGAIRFVSDGRVEYCNFTNNYARSSEYSAGTISFASKGTLSNCNFNNSFVMGDTSLWAAGAVMFVSTGTVTNCTFTNCSSKSNRRDASGAILFLSDGKVYYSSFVNNSATAEISTPGSYGSGAICFSGTSSVGEVYHCNFTNNALYSYNGGGAIRFAGTGNVVNSTFTNNSANYYGGAIYFAAKGTVDSSNFTYNRAKIGSAIYYYNPGESKITNTVLLKNKADAKSFSIEQSANVFTITFSGNDNHLNAIYTRNDEALEFENVTYWGAKGISNTGSNVLAANSNESGQNITVSISHDDISMVDGVFVTDENGQIVLTMHSAGIFKINVRHDDDEYYTGAVKQETLEILGYETTTKLTVEKTAIGIKLIAKVDAKVNPARGNVTFFLTDSEGRLVYSRIVDLTNGAAECNVNHLQAGIYNITAIYNGNRTNWPSKDSLIYSYKYDPIIVIETESIKQGQVEIINVTLNGNKPDLINATLTKDGLIQTYTIKKGQLVLDNLETGVYTIIVSYDGDDEYEASSNSSTFHVVKNKDYVINITSIVTTNSVVNITAVSDFNNSELGGRFEFLLPNNQVIRPFLSGDNKTWWFMYYLGGEGAYDIKGQYMGFNQVTINNGTVTIKAINNTYEIKLNVTVRSYASNTTIKVTVPSELKDNVKLTIDGISYTINIADNGTGVLNISTLSAGNHYIQATSGNEFYATKTNSTMIIVPKATPDIIVDAPATVAPGNNATITVSVLNVTEGYVTILINGQETTLAVGNDGKATLNITDVQPGIYNISAKFFGNDNYTQAQTKENVTVNVSVFDASISVINVTVSDNNNVTITVKVNKLDATGTVNITLPNGNNVTVKVIDGIAVVNLGILQKSNENYTLPVHYSGDRKYSGNTTTANFKVGKLSNATVVIVINPGKYGENTTITVIIPDDADGNVTVSVDGADITPVVKNTDGTYTVNVTTTLGSHEVIARLVNDTKYEDATNTTFFIGEANTDYIIGLEVVVRPHGENTTITVTVPSELKDNVTLTIDDEEYEIIINEKGTGILNVSTLSAGNHVVSVTSGNLNYASKTNMTWITVPKATHSIVIHAPETIAPGSDIDIRVSVADDAVGYVNILINGEDNIVAIKNDGNATFTILNIQPGQYNISAKYLGNDNYLEVEAQENKTLNVPLFDASVNVISVDIGDNNNVTITVKIDKDDATGKVNVTLINGETITADVVNGQAVINLGILKQNNDNYTLPVHYSGDDKYSHNSTLTNFKVGKLNNATVIIHIHPGHVSEYTKITVIVPDDADGNVTISVDGQNITPVIKNPDGSFTAEVMTNFGIHEVVAKLVNDTGYDDTVNTSSFTGRDVIDHVVEITVIPRQYGENTTIIVDVLPELKDNVNLTIDGVKYSISINEHGSGVLNISTLAAGNHLLEVSAGNYKYVTKTNYTSFKIDKANPTIGIVVEGSVPGENVTITVETDLKATGKVVITVDGVDHVVDVIAGKATYAVVNAQPGKHNVSARYLGDNNYTSSDSFKSEFTIPVFNTSINVLQVIVDKNNNVTVVVGVNYTDADGTVNITLPNGENVTADVAGGVANINLGVLPKANYALDVTYSGNAKYAGNATVAKFSIGKLNNLTANITIIAGKYGQNTSIAVTVSDDFNGNVTISIDDVEYLGVKVGKDIYAINVTTTVGRHNVTAILLNDTKYNDVTLNDSFIGLPIDDYDINVTIANDTVEIKVPSQLKDNVTVMIDDIKRDVIFNDDGTGILDIYDLPTGTHQITVSTGNENYTAKTYHASFIKEYKNPDYNDASVIIDLDNRTLNIILDKNATGNVTITIDNGTYTANIADGVATFDLSNLTSGEYPLRVEYSGDSNNYPISVNTTITIPKLDTPMKITVDNNIVVTVPANATGNITIYANGVVLTSQIKDGNATFASGLTGTIVAVYNGDANYLANNTIFTIPKPVVTYRIIANNFVMFYLDGSYYTVRVVDSNNNPVSKANVKISVNGKTYNRVTNAKGYASLKIRLKPKTYKVTSEFNGIKVSKNIKVKHAVWAKKTTKIKKSAKKATIKILVSGPKKKTLSKNVKFKYKGKRKVKVNFGIEMKKQKVKVRFKGKTYKVKVKSNGKGTLKLKKKTAKKLKKGKNYKTKVKFKGSKIYSKVKVKVKFLKKTYKVKTNKFGVGKFKINKKAMKKLKKNKKFKKGKKVKYTIAYKNDKIKRYIKAKK